MIYLIGSLRNPEIPVIGNYLREQTGEEIFDDWFAAGPIADDSWQAYENLRGSHYKQALQGYPARHVFDFDHYHLNRADAAILVLPAGKSAHMEFGYIRGQGKPGWVLFPPIDTLKKLPEDWYWVAGMYEGEGAITYNRGRDKLPQHLVITLSSTDKDVIDRLQEITKVGRLQGPYHHKNTNLKTKGSTKPAWRWAVYKQEDVAFVLRGIYPLLGNRRKQQVETAIRKINKPLTSFLGSGNSPHEFRYDVMYQFASDIHFYKEELLASVQRWRCRGVYAPA